MRLRIVLFVLLIAPASCKAHPAPTSATATAKAVFRFSPRPNRAAEVHWRAWDPAVFADARAQHKPILLSLAAIWCHWCHVLDETTLSDPRVIALLNRDFLPVRVDADQHPEVERRYLLGGWPTVAFLTPQGEIIDGGTYVPPDAFVALGESALAAFREGGAALNDHLARYRQREDPVRPGPVDAQIVETVARTLGGEADRKNGGFGGAPKFPNGEAVTLLFDVGETELAKQALDGMLRLEDPVAGGFYRYAMSADWTHPHYEKMLRVNAELLAAYARGFRVTHDERYRACARRIAAYLRANLFDPSSGMLWASQDADEIYYGLDEKARAARPAPYIDRTLLVDRASIAVEALSGAARELDDPSLLDLARRAIAPILAMQEPDGRFAHARQKGGAPEVRGQLADQAHAALALYALASALPGSPDAARFRKAADRALDGTLRTLAAPAGGYYDADAGTLGLTANRRRPLEENAAFARALLAGGRRAEAAKTLAAFAGSYALYGGEAAGYARAVRELIGEK